MFQPTFIQQAADLIHPNNQVPMSLRTTTLFCLDTVSRIRSRVGEVTASLSVNVNHGTLMSILRKLVTDLHSEKRKYKRDLT
jgi:E3 ubiquitin-protein ligase HUWE1